MKVTNFTRHVALREGKKVSVNIAQTAEVLKVANLLCNGAIYKAIRDVI